MKINIYTDGACLGNPGPGGWAYIITDESGFETSNADGTRDTTNNRMELTAAIESLRSLRFPCEVTLHTDSTYVEKGINEWLAGWIRKDFVGVSNSDLWKALNELLNVHKVTAVWIKAHNGHEYNERCDVMARNEAKKHQSIKNAYDSMRALSE
jgi:ribonuclease HI